MQEHLNKVNWFDLGQYTNDQLVFAYLLYSSNVFNEVEVNSYQIWKYQYYYLVMEYNKQPPLAPPFAIIYHLVEFLQWLGKKCRKPNKVTRKWSRAHFYLM